VGADLCPAGLGVGEVRAAHRHGVAGVIDNSLSPPIWACRIVADSREARPRYSSQNRE
jgi:hypothetical protein